MLYTCSLNAQDLRDSNMLSPELFKKCISFQFYLLLGEEPLVPVKTPLKFFQETGFLHNI